MKRKHLTLLILLALFGCNESVDNRVIENMDEFELAKDYLIQNLEEIHKSRDYSRHDSLMLQYYKTIFAANRYYFENSLVPNYPGLSDLLRLWDKNMVDNNEVVHSLILKKDSIVKFTIKSDIGFFSGTSHQLIFNPYACCDDQIDEYSEILFQEKLKDNWYYIVRKKYYAD